MHLRDGFYYSESTEFEDDVPPIVGMGTMPYYPGPRMFDPVVGAVEVVVLGTLVETIPAECVLGYLKAIHYC